jgi:hypothetical protein
MEQSTYTGKDGDEHETVEDASSDEDEEERKERRPRLAPLGTDIKGIRIQDMPRCFYLAGAIFVIPAVEKHGGWNFTDDLYLAEVNGRVGIYNLRVPPEKNATPPVQWIAFHFNVKPVQGQSCVTVIKAPHLTLRGLSLRRYSKLANLNPQRSVQTEIDKRRQIKTPLAPHKYPGDEGYFIWGRDAILNQDVAIHTGEPAELFEVPPDRGLPAECREFLYQIQSALLLAIAAIDADHSIRMAILDWTKMQREIERGHENRSAVLFIDIELTSGVWQNEIRIVWNQPKLIVGHVMGLCLAAFELRPSLSDKDCGEIVLTSDITAAGDSPYLADCVLTLNPHFAERFRLAGSWQRRADKDGDKYTFRIYHPFVPVFALLCRACRQPDKEPLPRKICAFLDLFTARNWPLDEWALDQQILFFADNAETLLQACVEALYTPVHEWPRIARLIRSRHRPWTKYLERSAKNLLPGRRCTQIITICMQLIPKLDAYIVGAHSTAIRDRFVTLQAFLISQVVCLAEVTPLEGLYEALLLNVDGERTWICNPCRLHIRPKRLPNYERSKNIVVVARLRDYSLGIIVCPAYFESGLDFELFASLLMNFFQKKDVTKLVERLRRAARARQRALNPVAEIKLAKLEGPGDSDDNSRRGDDNSRPDGEGGEKGGQV